MPDLLLGLLLLGAFGWLFSQWGKLGPQLEKKERDYDPLTGAIYAPLRSQAQDGVRNRR